MNPDIYTALPPEKKGEYKKLFQEPIIEPIIQPKICVDDRIPEGYALFGNQFVALLDAQNCTSEEIKPFDIEELRSLFKTWEKLEPDINLNFINLLFSVCFYNNKSLAIVFN